MVDLRLAACLRALRRGRACRCATHRRTAILPHALVICPVVMAGEDTAVRIVAFGAIGEEPEVICVPDPRRRHDGRYTLLRRLGEHLEHYYRYCREQGTHPQIWTSSSVAASLLDAVAESARYAVGEEGDVGVEAVRRVGALLSYATDRLPYPGQQALVTATGALSAHFATGQHQSEDEHLGALLCWIEPPEGIDVHAAVAAAERVPMGAKTDPAFDNDVLEPLVRAYNAARRDGASKRELAARAKQIERALTPVAERIYESTQRAIRLLQEANMPPLPALANLDRREVEAFESFMSSRDAGYHLTLRDRPGAAAFKLAEREDAAQNFEAAVMVGDGVARAQGLLSGKVVRGTVENPYRAPAGPRRQRYFFDLVSMQRVLRMRRGDELRLLDGRTFKVVVLEVRREGDTTRLSVELKEGMRAVGLPAVGDVLQLIDRLPDWNNLLRERGHMGTRLANTPWTHSNGRAPDPTRPRMAPVDPLAAVEALR